MSKELIEQLSRAILNSKQLISEYLMNYVESKLTVKTLTKDVGYEGIQNHYRRI